MTVIRNVIQTAKQFFRPKLVEHTPGCKRVYKNCLGFKTKIEKETSLVEGKNRVISTTDNFFTRMTNPIISRIGMNKSIFGIPLVSVRKTVITDGENVVSKRVTGYLKDSVDDRIAEAYSTRIWNI